MCIKWAIFCANLQGLPEIGKMDGQYVNELGRKRWHRAVFDKNNIDFAKIDAKVVLKHGGY
jgi:hypothetical protein